MVRSRWTLILVEWECLAAYYVAGDYRCSSRSSAVARARTTRRAAAPPPRGRAWSRRRSLWIVRAGVYSGSVDTDRLSHISTTFVDLLHF